MTSRAPAAPAEIPTLAETLRMFLRVVRLTRPFWGRLIKGIWLGGVLGVVGLVTPWISKLLIDEAYPGRDFALMHVLVAGGLAIGVASRVMGAIRGYYTQVVTAELGSAANLVYYNHVTHLGGSFFERRRVGEILSRFGDLSASLGMVSTILDLVLLRGVYLVLVPPILLWLNWRLALLALATTPPVIVISTLSARALRKQWKASAEAGAELGALRMEGLSQIRTIRGVGAEEVLYGKVREGTEAALRLRLRATGLGTVVGVGNGLLRAVGTAAMSWYAWTLILGGTLTLGGYMAFMAYLGYVTGPMNQMASLVSRVQQWAVSLGRTFEYLEESPEWDPKLTERAVRTSGNGKPPEDAGADAGGEAPPMLTGGVALRGVTFAYEAGRPVLADVSFEIEAGSVVALVGASGSGKSTVLKLVGGFERPDEGAVVYEGAPRDLGLRDLRRHVTVVWQDAGLLQGTVRENLTLGAPGARAEEVERALAICRLEEVLEGLEGRLDAPVAEWGQTLSGGQRQRMAIARALVRRTPLLILDEATSNVDVETERELLRALLLGGLAGRTLVFVTHRVGTAELADRIGVLERGRLVGWGTHEELLEGSEAYRRLRRRALEGGEELRRLRAVTP